MIINDNKNKNNKYLSIKIVENLIFILERNPRHSSDTNDCFFCD